MEKQVKILIAEDEEYNQMVVQAMVEILYPDVAITIVENGAEALEKLTSEPFDLLLTDVDMPVMNGYILVDEIKKLGISLPMICVTAFAISGDREKLLLHGFDNYISKPIDMDEMKRVLDNYIDA
jgi:two-component system, cell cycle response regulator DivK